MIDSEKDERELGDTPDKRRHRNERRFLERECCGKDRAVPQIAQCRGREGMTRKQRCACSLSYVCKQCLRDKIERYEKALCEIRSNTILWPKGLASERLVMVGDIAREALKARGEKG